MSVRPSSTGRSTASSLPIRTPDRRVRVFVSSTLEESAAERRATRDAVAGLHQTPIMFETGARHHPPRELYRAYLSQSDVFVGIYWQKYGWVAPGEEVSGLEDEYLLSGDRPKLIYIKQAATRDERLTALLERIKAADTVAYKYFTTSEELAELVADDLAILFTEGFNRGAGATPPGLRPPRLPVPPTAIVGRDTEVNDVAALLAQPAVRLVTLVGSGGIGKTRLALELAAAITTAPDSDLDGVWFVDLTSIGDPSMMLGAVAAALGIHREGDNPLIDVLADRLEERRLLVVLDNFEQVMPAAPDLAALLSACPGLTVLVTSRSVLRLRGEREVTLLPLRSPAVDGPQELNVIARSPAVQLFVMRGHQVRDSFTLTTANAAAVADLCRRLDGVPLALELAAAQLRLLSPQALLQRLAAHLERSLDLASGPVDLPDRQQTLRATVEWSYSLLQPAEQRLLDRLSIFAGPWTIEAAEAVGFDKEAPDVLATMSSLVAQSLVVPHDRSSDEPRFTMFGTVRAFGLESLRDRGEHEPTMQRLTTFVRDFAVAAGAGLVERGNRVWVERIDGFIGDLRAVMNHALTIDDPETVVAVSAPLFTYWWSHGQLDVMSDLAEQAAALPSAPSMPPIAAATLLWGRGMFHISSGRADEAQTLLEQLLDVATSLGSVRLRAHALAGIGVGRATTDIIDARRLLAEAISCFRNLSDWWGLAFALTSAGALALLDNDFPTAAAMHSEGLDVAREIENAHLEGLLLDLIGLDALPLGDLAGARQNLAAAARIHADLLDQEGSAYCLAGLAAIALAQDQPEAAAQLLGAASHARASVGVAIWPAMQPLGEGLVAAVAGSLPGPQLDAARTRGLRMRTSEALIWGVETTAPADGPPAEAEGAA